MSNVHQAKEFALSAHQHQSYGSYPYSYHLHMVVDIIESCFIDLFYDNAFYIYKKYIAAVETECVIAGYLHDILEDVGYVGSFNDLKKKFPDDIISSVDIVYACTAEKGRNRAERFNDKFYLTLRNTPFASFVKGCDRYANMKHSKETGHSMFKKYKKELPDFLKKSFDITERNVNMVEVRLNQIIRTKLERI